MTFAFLFVAVVLVVGILLRSNVAVFRKLFIPSSVIAGFVGFFVIQLGLKLDGLGVAEWAVAQSQALGSWPGWLIAVVFAGMLLIPKESDSKSPVRRVVRQGIMVWVIVLGETAVGLLVVWILVLPFFDVPNSFGMLIETGFAGGHGTAAAMGEVFKHPTVQLEGGKDLGMLMATFGLIYGIVSGIFWINLGVRNNWIRKTEVGKESKESLSDDFIGIARIDSDSVDPLLFQVIWLALAFGLGMLGQTIVMWMANTIDLGFASAEELDAAGKELSKRLSVSNVLDFPLFIYTLFGGLLVRKSLERIQADHWIDGKTIQRLTSAAMDVLVVAAISSLNLSVVFGMAVPFLMLFIAGAIWTAICLLLISRWLLPQSHWFELGLINYGMSTGTTATGFVLLKMVDPMLKSNAAEDYALAAPLSAPFIGGGMITIALPFLVLERVPIAIPALVVSAVVIGLVIVGSRIATGETEAE